MQPLIETSEALAAILPHLAPHERIAIDTEDRYYYFCVGILFLIVAIVRGVRRSRTGRVLIGVRENSRAAQSYGVNATTAKLTGFAISGFIAAVAGGTFKGPKLSGVIAPLRDRNEITLAVGVVS